MRGNLQHVHILLDQSDRAHRAVPEPALHYERALVLWRRLTGRVHERPASDALIGWLLEQIKS